MALTFQDVLNAVAQVVGGTSPDPINRASWYSGDQVGDGSGIIAGSDSNGNAYPTFRGCYSAPQDGLPDTPIGLVLPGPFEVGGPRSRDVYVRGVEQNIDDLRLLILVTRQDAQTMFPNLTPYRDLVPAAFAASMTAGGAANVLQAMVRGGKPIVLNWGVGPAAVAYDGWEFTIRVIRLIPRIYTA